MATQEETAWVERVLGIRTAASEPTDDAEESAEFEERLADARVRAQMLTRANAPEAEAMNAKLLEVTKLIADRAATAAPTLLELEEAMFAAETAGRAKTITSEVRVPLTLRKLMIEWRAAQQAADAGIRAIGDAYLNDPEVQEDPRFDTVLETVRELPALIPKFGAELSDAVDAVFNDGAKTKSVVAAGVKAVRDYRSTLESASILADLEALAREDLGGDFPISAPMLATLSQLESELRRIA